MALRKIFISLMLFAFVLAGVSAASAQNDHWRRLGQKDVDFGMDHDRIIARDKGTVRELHFVVSKNPIKFAKVVINYHNGEKQEVEYAEQLVLDKESRAITIEGTGRKIDSIDIWYSTEAMSGKKAKLTVYGRG